MLLSEMELAEWIKYTVLAKQSLHKNQTTVQDEERLVSNITCYITFSIELQPVMKVTVLFSSLWKGCLQNLAALC